MRFAVVVMLLASACAPSVFNCPPSSVERTVCTRCGPSDACEQSERICASACTASSDCETGRTCINSACVPFPCG